MHQIASISYVECNAIFSPSVKLKAHTFSCIHGLIKNFQMSDFMIRSKSQYVMLLLIVLLIPSQFHQTTWS